MSGEAMQYDFEILIVGGGMAGASLACALAQAGVDWRIGLVDPAPRQVEEHTAALTSGLNVDDYDLRVSALTPASEAFLHALHCWQPMAEIRVSPYRKMRVWDAEGTAEMAFDAADLYQSALGHIVENRVTLDVLWQRLRALPVQVLANRVSGLQRLRQGMELRLADDQRLRARLVVAADGAESPLRRMAGFATREWDYEQHALVATVATAQPHLETAWQRFLPTGPLAFLPLSSDTLSSIVWSTSPEQASELLALDEAQFRSALGAALEERLGAVTAVSRRVAFPLRQRHAKEYVQPGIALVADAAHSIHPLAGQGMNLGFLDVAVLADELLRAVERGQDYADLAVLRRYQRRRMGHNLAMMSAMEGFKRLFGADALPLRWLRNTGMHWLNRQGFLKRQIAQAARAEELLPQRWLQPASMDMTSLAGER